MRKKKILRILNRFNVGGPVYNATYLTKYLNPKYFSTTLIGGIHEKHEESAKYILDNEKINYEEIKYMRRKISPLYDLISLIHIIYIIYKTKPDIIHTHAAKAGLLGRIASLFYFKKVKLVHTYHGNVFEGYFSKTINKIIVSIERYLASRTDKIIAISQVQKTDLVNKYLICDESKIEVIPLGFDLKKFSNNIKNKRNLIRKKYNISNEEVLISIVGRVVPIKNHKLFIDVFNYCKLRTNVPIKALIIGDGSEMEDLINYTNENGLSFSYKKIIDNYDVLFCSWQRDIDCFLAASDIVALTSYNEGTPVSIIESMASGKASISTNVGGVSDIIENFKSGIVSSGSVKEFGNDLLNLINDENLRLELGKNAKSRSLELFNYNVLVNNVEKLYKLI
jgi:glycosyltransferase involved in cell wall biosynthesis